MMIFLVPLVMLGVVYHYYQTYNSDVLEHYYTLREAGLFLLIYSQALLMCLGVGKPLLGLFLIGLEAAWLVFNVWLYRYGEGMGWWDCRRHIAASCAVAFGLFFLSLEQQVGWVTGVVTVSIALVVLLVVCGYSLMGMYYYNIFKSARKEPEA